MEKLYQEEIQALEAQLDIKVREIKGGDEEESKEEGLLKHKLAQLRESLADCVAQVVREVEVKVRSQIEKARKIKLEVDTIKAELNHLKTKWLNPSVERPSSSNSVLKEKIKFMTELEALEEKISTLKVDTTEPLKVDDFLQFEKSKIMHSLLETVDIAKSPSHPEEQPILLHKDGSLNILKGVSFSPQKEVEFPDLYASFQLNDTLFICGGSSSESIATIYSNKLFSLSSEWEKESLEPMSQERDSLSLTGIETMLLATGGWRESTLKVVEQYLVLFNKWLPFPSLNEARQVPGTCISSSHAAYCFCGVNCGVYSRTVERIEIGGDSQWSMLTLNQEMKPTAHLTAVPFFQNLLLFGGCPESGFTSQMIDSQGRVVCDSLSKQKVPGFMCEGAYTVYKWKVYALSGRREEGEKMEGLVFESNTWRQIKI